MRVKGPHLSLELVGLVDNVFYWHDDSPALDFLCAGHFFEKNTIRTGIADLRISDLEKGRHIFCECNTISRKGQH